MLPFLLVLEEHNILGKKALGSRQERATRPFLHSPNLSAPALAHSVVLSST